MFTCWVKSETSLELPFYAMIIVRTRLWGSLDSRIQVKEILQRPLTQKNGELFVLDVDSPLFSDHLRSRICSPGFVSDGSFSPTIVKLSLEAVIRLMKSYLSEEERKTVQKVLVAAGAPDSSFRGVLRAMMIRVGSRMAPDAGEAIVDKAAEYLGPLMTGAMSNFTRSVQDLFQHTEQDA